MKVALKKHIPDLCCWSGALCLALTAASCLRLKEGGPVTFWLAAAFLLLAGLALWLLRLEKVSVKQLKLMLLPIGAAMLVRSLCMDHAGSDYDSFLLPWTTFYRNAGGFRAIASDTGDYNVPYQYILALISYIHTPPLYPIKLVSVLVDVLLAWGGFRLVQAVRGRREADPAPLAAFALLLLLPTAVLNSAYWAQCDAVYGALVVHALACALRGKNASSAALLGAAFCFKLQTVFLIPLWGVLFLAKRIRFRELFAFPAAYLLLILPALLLGKPLKDMIGVYFYQMGEYSSRLCLNAPSVYALLPDSITADMMLAPLLGIAAAFLLALALMGTGYLMKDRLDDPLVLSISVVMAVGIPFFLPYMHERYFFLADVLTACWACVSCKRLPAAVLSVGASLYSYSLFLFGCKDLAFSLFGLRFSGWLGAAAMLAALLFSTVILVRALRLRSAVLPGSTHSAPASPAEGNLP